MNRSQSSSKATVFNGKANLPEVDKISENTDKTVVDQKITGAVDMNVFKLTKKDRGLKKSL